MAPDNFSLMQNARYAADLNVLFARCRERHVAVQTVKSIARRPWGGRPKTFNTYFYEPLVAPGAIDRAVHWVLGDPGVFLITAGDVSLLPKILDAAGRFVARPSAAEMAADAAEFGIEPAFA